MEFNTDSFGVTRPPSESLPERGKLLKLESELQPNLGSKPQPESELQPNLEPKPQPESKLQPNLERKPRLEYLLSSKPMKKLKMSDFSMYDDEPEPFMFMHRRFVYKNKAQIKLDEEIKVAMDDHRERSRNLSPFDAIGRPKISDTCGGGPRPIPITESVRLELTPLCKLALDKYNADKDTHFVFADIVKSTWCPGAMYYITFLAQDSSNNNNNTSLTTFQAQVSNRRPAPKVYSYAIKT
ncbi:unnamed protein product [Lathyrus sativus]|nr:unnamed protein product [Lathyrus sativus]